MNNPTKETQLPGPFEVKGDIFDFEGEAIVNPVNCRGVAGCGLAMQFADRYPANFTLYRQACQMGTLEPGKLCVHQTMGGLWLVNFPTKHHWKFKSKPEYIAKGLATLVQWLDEKGIKSIAIPRLGCGAGGLEWGRVKPMIVRAFELRPEIQVTIVYQ